jgi:hypothetical protein
MLVHLNSDEIETDRRRGGNSAAKAEERVHGQLDALRPWSLKQNSGTRGKVAERPVFVTFWTSE